MFLFCCLVYFLLMLHRDLQSFFNQLPIVWTKNNWKGTLHAHAEYAKLWHPACWKSSHINPAFPQKCSVPPSMRSMWFKTYRFNFAVPICVTAPTSTQCKACLESGWGMAAVKQPGAWAVAGLQVSPYSLAAKGSTGIGNSCSRTHHALVYREKGTLF